MKNSQDNDFNYILIYLKKNKKKRYKKNKQTTNFMEIYLTNKDMLNLLHFFSLTIS